MLFLKNRMENLDDIHICETHKMGQNLKIYDRFLSIPDKSKAIQRDIEFFQLCFVLNYCFEGRLKLCILPHMDI